MKHWFGTIARNRLASEGKNRGEKIKHKLEEQEYKCVYTGIVLIPGRNASLDHILPISRGGTHEIENLQWVDIQINRMKTDMTHQEFIQMCHKIVDLRK